MLRKQLEETQDALDDEKNNSLSVQAKVKDVTVRLAASEKQNSAMSSHVQEMEVCCLISLARLHEGQFQLN